MRDMLFSFEINIEEIIIHNLVDGIFYSTIICKHNGETYEFDSRTSDAVALSTRFKCPIYTYESILEQAGVSIDTTGDEMGEPVNSTSVSKTKETNENDYTKYTITELDKMLAKFIESEEYEKAAAIQKELDSRK
jgi:bifunctional DNase/RNase